MTVCEMCGKKGDLFKTEIEGIILNVCVSCSKHGKVLKKPVVFQKTNFKKSGKELEKSLEKEEFLVFDFGKKIRKKREDLQKTQKEFADLLNEKESIVQKMENGSFEPPLPTARRFEKILKIKLVDSDFISASKVDRVKSSSEAFTIGDVISKKKS
jgi:uncharacterized protein (TIGR00270 family)